ncbi:MAG: hypothetical protein P8L66_11370 [Rhodospirillaceae bacterium]|nr:hypothetical protein [Rhodospirillaceae bacterium]
MPKSSLGCGPKQRFIRNCLFLLLRLFIFLGMTAPANAQGWNMNVLESAYDDFAAYLEQMGEFSPDDWQYKIGVAVGTVPDYSGSNQYEAKGLPIFQIRYKDDIWIDPLGVRVKVWSSGCCRLLAQAGIATGRSPDKDSRAFFLPDI